MKPVGLAFKNYEFNPFTQRGSGELMIIHICLACSKVSPNRIAGDDNEYQILSLLETSKSLDTTLVEKLKSFGIDILTDKDKEDILSSLFGTTIVENI